MATYTIRFSGSKEPFRFYKKRGFAIGAAALAAQNLGRAIVVDGPKGEVARVRFKVVQMHTQLFSDPYRVIIRGEEKGEWTAETTEYKTLEAAVANAAIDCYRLRAVVADIFVRQTHYTVYVRVP